MKRTLYLAATFFMGVLSLGHADEPKTSEARVLERRAAIEKMKDHDRAEAYAKLSLELTELAYEQYKANETEAGAKTAAQIGDAAVKSVEAARMKHKKIKQAEIKLRECSRRLDEVRRSIPVSDQVPVKEALTKVEKARADILEAMFKK